MVLKQTLHMFLSAMWNFEFCTVSKKPREGFFFFNKLQNPTKVQACQNLQDNSRDRGNMEYVYNASERQHERFEPYLPFFYRVQVLLALFLLFLFQSKSCSVIQKSTKPAFIFIYWSDDSYLLVSCGFFKVRFKCFSGTVRALQCF